MRKWPQAAPQLLAVEHLAGEKVAVPQHLGGGLHVSLADELADVGGGDGDPAQRHLVHHVDAHAPLGAQAAQLVRCALATVAEGEVVAADHMLCPQLPEQVILHKGFPGHLHHGAVKMRQNHLIHGEFLLHQVLSILQGVDKGHRLVIYQGVGVGVEGQHRRGDPQLIGTAAGEAQQGGVPQVDAVKKAQGNDAVMFHGSFTSKKLLMVLSRPPSARQRAANPPAGS